MSNKRSGIMLCYPFEERRLRNEVRGQQKWTAPFLIQPKLDGERCRAVIGPENIVHLWSSEMNIIISVPHINEAIEKMNLPTGFEFDGELYQHDLDFSDIHSAVGRTVNLSSEHESIEYHIFDIVEESMSQLERLVHLGRIKLLPPLFKVENKMVDTPEEVLELLTNFTDLGYEGVIIRELNAPYVRKRSSNMMKFKPRKSDFYQIVDFKQERDQFGNLKNSLGALICIGNDGTPFAVGSGLTADQRRLWWLERFNLIGQLAHVKYQNITPAGVPRFPVFIKLLEPCHE